MRRDQIRDEHAKIIKGCNAERMRQEFTVWSNLQNWKEVGVGAEKTRASVEIGNPKCYA